MRSASRRWLFFPPTRRRRRSKSWSTRSGSGAIRPSCCEGTRSASSRQRLIGRYGDTRLKATADALMNSLDAFRPECSLEELGRPEHVVDDFGAAGIESKDDVRAVFAGNFYFGCEADDRAAMWAFDPRL